MSSDTESHLSPGTVVARRYRVDRVIGSGGFAVVYRAHHLSLDAPVALKVLRLGIGDSAERRERELERFVEEARILARFRHPGIVGVIDAGIEASAAMAAPFPWMALEWCEGATLAAEVGRRRGVALSPQEAWWIVRAVALAVGEAHAAGVVHRDLKPANVMLVRGKEGVEPRVLDFGIAKVIEASKLESDAATQGTLVCSPAYAAPEQVVGGVTGPWTDIHALGIIMTELLCCRAPYDVTGAGPIAALRPTPAAHGVDVGALEPVLSRAVALTPGDRFDDVASFIAAVDEAVGPPAPVHLSTPPSGPEPRSSPSTGRAGPAGRWSGPPAGGTERTAGARAPFDASSGVQRGSGRAYLGIAVGALLGFVLGAVATRLVASPPSAAPSSAATAASPSVAAPAPTAAARSAAAQEPPTAPTTVAALALDESHWQATLHGRPLGLTRREFKLLQVLARQTGRIFSRAQLLDQAYDDTLDVNERAIDSHIKNLRKKLKAASADGSDWIRSVYGVGFALDPTAPD